MFHPVRDGDKPSLANVQVLDPDMSPIEGVSEALRKMGIAPINELVTEDEQKEIEKELEEDSEENDALESAVAEESLPEEETTTPTTK